VPQRKVSGPGQAACVAPPHPVGPVDIVIANPGGAQATLPDGDKSDYPGVV